VGNLIEVAGHVPHEDGKGSEVVFKSLRDKETLLEVGKGGLLEADGRFFPGFLGVLLDSLIFRGGEGAVDALDAWSIKQDFFEFPPAGFFQFLHGISVRWGALFWMSRNGSICFFFRFFRGGFQRGQSPLARYSAPMAEGAFPVTVRLLARYGNAILPPGLLLRFAGEWAGDHFRRCPVTGHLLARYGRYDIPKTGIAKKAGFVW